MYFANLLPFPLELIPIMIMAIVEIAMIATASQIALICVLSASVLLRTLC